MELHISNFTLDWKALKSNGSSIDYWEICVHTVTSFSHVLEKIENTAGGGGDFLCDLCQRYLGVSFPITLPVITKEE